MRKDELIRITLDQLIENFHLSPESFQLNCPELHPYTGNTAHETIIWKRNINLDGTVVPDPNGEQRTIFFLYNKNTRELSCHIFFRDVTLTNINGTTAEASTSTQVVFRWFDSNYKKFQRLKNNILHYERQQENNKFLIKLSSIFPGTFEEDIFGKK